MNNAHIIQANRWIGKIQHSYQQPTCVFIGGVHGNEQTGVKAIEHVFDEIKRKNIATNGNIYGLRGNLKAMATNKRFIDVDLNRVWTEDKLPVFVKGHELAEVEEVLELKQILDELIEKTKAPLYFMDLHTTSSFSPPFVIIDDTIRNRKMVNTLPVTKVLGIIEKLNGTILGYYGDKGPITAVFEAGQHEEQSSLDRHIAAIWLTLVYGGIISEKEIDLSSHQAVLDRASSGYPLIVETKLRYELQLGDQFEMEPGFANFSPINKGQKIAIHNGVPLHAKKDSLIFMPLYQKQGEDGYFIVKEIAPVWLKLSGALRKLKVDQILHLLPGIKKDPNNSQGYIVNREIASFKSIQILHLFGYRRSKVNGQFTHVFRRPFDFKGPWD